MDSNTQSALALASLERKAKDPKYRNSRRLKYGALGGVLSGASKDGRFLRAYERMLIEHLGGKPNAVQRALITRACRLALFVEKMDERALESGTMCEHDSAMYLAWHNGLRRTLGQIGIKGADPTASAEPTKPLDAIHARYGGNADDDEDAAA
jgi:hypothetical protein